MIRQRSWMTRVLVPIAILGLTSLSRAAQAKPTSGPSEEKVVKEVTLRQVRAILGMAADDLSGVADFSLGGNGEIVVAYHYYDIDQANYETDFASEITPRIQQMYKKFKTFDRVRFEIEANNPSAPPLWIPFSEFVIDRKTIEDLHYSWFVARYILDQTLKHKR